MASQPRLEVLTGFPAGDDNEAWQWLRDAIADHGPMLWRFVLPRVAGMTDVAEGICQETWQALARQPVPPRELSAWLRGTARHKVMDQFRRERRRAFWEVPLEIFQGKSEDPETVLEARWETEQVWAALRRMPVRSRQLLVLHYLEGWSVVEMAELTGRTPKAVECQLYRARVAFRGTYEESPRD